MPSDQERIQAIKDRIARKKAKLAALPAIQRLTAAIKADEAKAEKLELETMKRRADQRRRDDTQAKIIIGAGVSLLPAPHFNRTMREIITVLAKRDQDRIEDWLKERDIELKTSATAADDITTSSVAHSPDPIGDILKRAFSSMGAGTYELFSAEILGRVGDQDRSLLEGWFSTLDQSRE